MKYQLELFLFMFSFLWISCDQEDLAVTNVVDSELQTYVNTFEAEAAARGMSFDIESMGIAVELMPIDEQNVAGVCYYSSNHPGRIEIDLQIWQQMGDLDREYVVFHELGHCAMNRDHSEAQFANGTCRSIMASGTGACRENYSWQTRSIYLNELFSGL
jgi:hypothetical protein